MNNYLAQDAYKVLPELLLAGASCLILLIALIGFRNFIVLKALAVLACVASILVPLFNTITGPTPVFLGMLRVDDFSNFFGMLTSLGGILTLLMSRHDKINRGAEYLSILLAIILGGHLAVMSMNFVVLLLSLETISIGSYTLAGWGVQRRQAEGSLKYFLFGTAATATMLYGMSLLFGITGTLYFSSETFMTNALQAEAPQLITGGLLTFAGLLFKLSAVPFHVWTPDVYEAAPVQIVAFISVVPKIAGLGVFIKVLLALNLFGQSIVNWTWVCALLSILSMTFGNFSALRQKHPRRMLAYSSIAQSGFMLAALAPVSREGTHAAMFYATIFLIANFVAFIALQAYEDSGTTEMLTFSGRGHRQTTLAVFFVVSMVSLTGLPITAGFTGKFFVFSELWAAYYDSRSLIFLAVLLIALGNTVVSLFYYFRIPYYLFMREGTGNANHLNFSPSENLLMAVLVILLIALFLKPDLLMGWIIQVKFVL